MGVFVEYLIELGMDLGKDFFKNSKERQEIKNKICTYIEAQENINELSTLADEIDFQGLKEYISSELLGEIRCCLFTRKDDRSVIKESIVGKACSYAKADNGIKKSKIQKIINDILDIFYTFYRNQMSDEYLLMTNEIIDRIDEVGTKLSKKISDEKCKIMTENKSVKSASKINNNELFCNLHNLIMDKYIKKKYVEGELSDQIINKYSDLFKLTIDVFKDDKNIKVENNIFDFIRE